jgi:two-component system, NarL family, sensor kinase
VKLGLAEVLATRDPDKAPAAVAELKHDADEALETLRDLARAIYPPLLADEGNAAALQSHAGTATVRVHLDPDGVGRYSQEVEAPICFFCLEALQNVQKYASASHAEARLRQRPGELSFEVQDDGGGFDPAMRWRGPGLTNMSDRLDALGGAIELNSSPGTGTRLREVINLAPAAVAAK